MSVAKHPGATNRRKRSSHTARNEHEQPCNRPPGAPAAVGVAAGAFFLAVGGTLIELYSCAADLAGFDFADYALVEIAVCFSLMVVVGLGLRTGKLWAVKVFRRTTHAAVLLCPAAIACAVWLTVGKAPRDTALIGFVVALALFQIPSFIVIYRTLARVRWLDPESLPSEWEPPTGLASSSIRGNAPTTTGAWRRAFSALFAIGLTLRYYIGLIRAPWVDEWLGSGNVMQEAVALIAIAGPMLLIGIVAWLGLRARLRTSRGSE
jgi:hypothetical protein